MPEPTTRQDHEWLAGMIAAFLSDGLELLQMLGLVDPSWEWRGTTHPRRKVQR